MTFLRSHSSAIAVLIVGTVAIGAIFGVRLEASHREEGDERADRQTCEVLQSNRQGLIALVDVALADDSGPIDLDGIPEFQAVEAEVQALIRVLIRPSDGDSPVRERLKGFRDGIVATPLPDFCT